MRRINIANLSPSIGEEYITNDKVYNSVLCVSDQPYPPVVSDFSPLAIRWVGDEVGEVEDACHSIKQILLIPANGKTKINRNRFASTLELIIK